MDHQQMLIPVPPFFSFRECLWFLNRNYDDCLHHITERAVVKAVRAPRGNTLFQLCEKGSFLHIEILSGENSPETRDFLAGYISEWFDMGRDLGPFYELLNRDDRLGYMTESFAGLRLIGISDLFEALCWCIIGQQINLTFAYKLKRRLVERFGDKVEWGDDVFLVFPTPEILAVADPAELRAMQFSERKAQYLIGIAAEFASGALSRESLDALPDFESRQKALTSHKGIGIWTANYALMKSLREPRGIPHGDVGLLNALSAHAIIGDRNEKQKIDAFFESYAGWESYLTFYLWRSLAVKTLV